MRPKLIDMPGKPVTQRATSPFARVACALWLVACLLSRSALGQDLRYLRHGSWSTENGLPQNSVHQVLQTRDGFLWIATEGGVARFDGVSFKSFRHEEEPAFASNDACCLAETSSGDLWIGTSDGLVRLRQGDFRRFSEKDGLPSAAIVSLGAAGGGLLVGTASGLATQSGEHFVPGDSKLINAFRSPGTATRQAGALWTMTGQAVKLTSPGRTRTWSVPADLPGTRVQSLFLDRQGTAWVGTNGGLAVLKVGAERAESIPSLRGDSVLQTYEDREGNYWIGTETTGLHLLHAETFRNDPGLANLPLTAIAQSSDGDIWVGTRSDGLRRIHDGRVQSPVRPDALTSPYILSLAPGRNDDVWAGTPDGLNHVDATGRVLRVTSANKLPDDYIRALAAAPDGSVWIGTRRGVVRLKGDDAEVFTQADGLGSDLIGALLAASNGELWAGTSGGLSRIAADGRVVTFAAKDGLPSLLVAALAESPGGTIWIATGDGTISRLRDNRIAAVHSSGLQAGKIAALLADRAGFLWVRGEHVLQRVAVADLNACIDPSHACNLRVSRYSTADGMPSSEVVAGGSPLLFQMANSEVWAATQRGAGIAAGLPPPPAQPVPVAIERMLVDGSEQNLQHGPVTLAAGATRIDVEYAGLSYAAPLQVNYRYRLEGFDRDWTAAGTRRTATYTNLPPRGYTFRVEAMAADGTWVGAEARLAFRVMPPLYRRWWFLLLAVLLIACAAVALYRLRLRRLRGQFDAVLRERNRMAREIHDTLAQDFVGVALQLDLASQLLATGKADAARQQVQSTRKLVMDGLAEARRSIWDLRAATSEDSLPTRLAALVDRYSGPSLRIDLQIGGAYRQLGARTEEEFLRIAQEALSNVQRHAAAETASVQLHFGTDTLLMTVTDHGRGFLAGERGAAEGHFGLTGMHERAAAMGATLLIGSEPGRGTTVTLRANIAGEEKRPTR